MNYNIDWEKTVENIKYLMLGRTYKKNFSRVFGVDVRAVQKKSVPQPRQNYQLEN